MIGVRSHELGLRAWTEVPLGAVIVLPLGSTEQHGPHLPLGTDTIVAERLALAAAQSVEAVAVVAPAVAYGSSGEHAGFAGTLSIGRKALEMIVTELVRSLDDSRPAGVVLVNGHGGNLHPVLAAIRTLTDEGRRVEAWWPSDPDGDAHAGRTETSVMLHLAPELVSLDKMAAGQTRPLNELAETLRREGLRAVTASGVLGDPTGATAEHGAALVLRWTAEIAGLITGLRSLTGATGGG